MLFLHGSSVKANVCTITNFVLFYFVLNTCLLNLSLVCTQMYHLAKVYVIVIPLTRVLCRVYIQCGIYVQCGVYIQCGN